MKKTEAVDPVEIASKQRHLFLLNKIKNNKPLTAAELAELTEKEKKAKAKKTREKKTASIAAEQFLTTQKAAARYVGKDERTIRRWLENGMERIKQVDGKYLYIKSVLDFFQRNEGKEPDEYKEQLNKATAGHKEIKRELDEIRLNIEKKKFINAEEIQMQRLRKITEVKRVLMGLTRKLPPLLQQQSMRKMGDIIRKEIEHCINVFAGEKFK